MAEKVLLDVRALTKSFPVRRRQDVLAVNQVSFSLRAGECLAVVGESGCGKSTLVKMISGILPASSGSIVFMDKDVTRLTQAQWRQTRMQMQMVFQEPSSAFSPRMKIGQFLCEPYLNYGLKGKKAALEAAVAQLARVELDESYLAKYPHQLSGGELQRVAIARALTLSPKLLICDEVTSALDVSIQAQIIDLLKKLQREEQLAILFICHDLALVQQFCDRIMVLYLGRQMELLDRPDLTGSCHPYTRALIDSVFRVHGENCAELSVSAERPASLPALGTGCPFYERCPKAEAACRQADCTLRALSETHASACRLAQAESCPQAVSIT